MRTKTRVLIVDDSALMRKLLSELLGAARDIEVVGTAQDPFVARERIKKLEPDVLTLDVEMPRMDGLTFLSNLMRLRPMPVVMVSSLTEQGADVTLRALELGAVDFVAKPKIDLAHGFQAHAEELLEKVRVAARARVRARPRRSPPSAGATPPEAGGVAPKLSADAVLPRAAPPRHFRTTDQLIAIGASTGGTEAIFDVLRDMPPSAPAVVIAQHIPETFSASFARRLDRDTALSVAEARDGQVLLPGHVYVAPGSHHLLVRRNGARFEARLSSKPPVNRHRPSVDVLFRSVAEAAGPNALGAILTGMGDDGARGLQEMQAAGAYTLAQDEATSVVWGMPGEAVALGAARDVVPLPRVAATLLRQVRR